MMKKQVWQDAVYFYTRINKGTIDLPELRYYLCSTYPEVDFTEVTNGELIGVINKGRMFVRDYRFFKNIKTIDERTATLSLRHQDTHFLYTIFRLFHLGLSTVRLIEVSIEKQGIYYQIKATYQSQEAKKVALTLSSAITPLLAKVKRNKVKFPRPKNGFVVVWFRKQNVSVLDYEGIRQHLTKYLPDCISALRYVKKMVYLDILVEPKDGEEISTLTTRLKKALKQYPPLKERLSLFSFDFTTPQNLSEDNCLVFK